MKTIYPHLFASSDQIRRGDKYAMRFCDTCGLPESRTDVHEFPSSPVAVTEAEQRRYPEER